MVPIETSNTTTVAPFAALNLMLDLGRALALFGAIRVASGYGRKPDHAVHYRRCRVQSSSTHKAWPSHREVI
jgi:hypothetical protein